MSIKPKTRTRITKSFILVFSTRFRDQHPKQTTNVFFLEKIKKNPKLNPHQEMLIQMQLEVERNFKLFYQNKPKTLCTLQATRQ